MTEEQARKRFLEAVAAAGGQRGFAHKHHLSPAFVNDVVRGRRGLSDTICCALGLERHVTYSVQYTAKRMAHAGGGGASSAPGRAAAVGPMSARDIALGNEILRGVVGSGCHGTAIEGQDDRDEMGVFVEPPPNVCGLSACDHYISRTQPEGVRSGPGDLDLTMYSLRRYVGLAVQGNPTILLLVWLPEYITKTPLGDALIELRGMFHSQEAGKRFLGYLNSQLDRLTGKLARTTNRPELVAKYGYDTKFAMHALRLGLQGIEYMQHRRITLPVPEPHLTLLRAVRSGEVAYEDAVGLIEDAEARLRRVVETVEAKVERQKVNDFLVMAHWEHWNFIRTAERYST